MMFGIISVILEAIPRIFNIIWSILCGPIYYLISIFYEVFLTLPRINILRDLNIEGIYQRVTMILVIVMAFYITFEVVKYVVQPDIITDKEKGSGKLVQKIVIVILLIAFVPKIFDIAYELQGRIIRSDIFAKVLLDDYKESDNKINNMGGNFAANVYGIFYHVNEDVCPMTGSGELDTSKISQWNLFNCQQGKMIVDNNMMILRGVSTVQVAGGLLAPITALGQTIGLNLTATNSQGDTDFVITFNGLLALGVGVFILWTLIVYGVELAKRVFQLIYLQIIAPVAIISYIAPKKDGMLSKWTKQCITTYLDLFIRLAIINFILLIISLLHESFFDTDSLIQSFIKDWGISPRVDVLFWVYIFLILGLLNFAKKAPKMLSELFPSSGAAAGSFGFSGKDNVFAPIKSVIGGTSRAIGGTVGAYTGIKKAITSDDLKKSTDKKDKWISAATAGFAGAKAGYSKGGGIRKANTAALGSVHGDEEIVRNGGTVTGSRFHGGKNADMAKKYDRQISDLDDAIKAKGAVSSGAKETKVMKTTDSYMNEWAHRNIGNADIRGAAGKAIEKATRVYAVSSRDQTSRDEYKNKIEKAVSSVYDESIEKTKSDYRAQIIPISQNLYTLMEEQYEAQAKIKKLSVKQQENGLDANEMADLVEQQRIVKETKQKVGTIYNNLSQEQQESIGAIEKAMNTDIAKLEKEKQEVSAQIEAKVGADEIVFDEIQELLTEAKRVSKDVEYEYTDPTTGTKTTIKIDTTDNMQEFAADIGDVADAAKLGKTRIEQSPERKSAKANAAASGKSGK